MNINPIIIVFGVAGLLLGFLIPPISRRIISIKCKKQNKVVKGNHMDKLWFQITVCICNGILWTTVAFKLAPVSALLCSVLVTLAILFAIIDIRIHMIPNELVLVTLGVGTLFQLVHFGVRSLLLSLLCMLVMMLIYLLVGLILGMDKVGAGDVKLAGVMGLSLGYPSILTAVFFMSISMIAYCVIGIWIKKLTFVSMFPFAPFMMFGLMCSLGTILFQ